MRDADGALLQPLTKPELGLRKIVSVDEKAGHIWYEALQQINNPFATFSDWAEKTLDVAREQHGRGSLEVRYTQRAWKLVGVSV